jgi:hypothetical protein
MDKRKVQVSIPVTAQVEGDVNGTEFLIARFILDEKNYSVVVPKGRTIAECVQEEISKAVVPGEGESTNIVSSMSQDVEVEIEVEIQDDAATFAIEGVGYGVMLEAEDLAGDGVQDRVQEYFDVLTDPNLSALLGDDEEDEEQDDEQDVDPEAELAPQEGDRLGWESLRLEHETRNRELDIQVEANKQNVKLATDQNDIESDKVERTHEANCAEALCNMLSLLFGKDVDHDHDEPEFPTEDESDDGVTSEGDHVSQLLIDAKGDVLRGVSSWVRRNVTDGGE